MKNVKENIGMGDKKSNAKGVSPHLIDRQAAREALERGDIESAKKHLASAEKSFNIGCLLYIALIVVILIIAAYSK